MMKLACYLLCCFIVVACHPSVLKFDQREWQKLQNEKTQHFVKGKNVDGPSKLKYSRDQDRPLTCGYKGCDLGRDDMINVHIVPHTHDDVGWLKTVDEYYYGARDDIQHAGVQYILDTVIQQLINDPNKRFIYVEVAYFYRWWNQQDDYLRHQVKNLVNNGQLEFILGGWCMNDEASTHYNAIIDQHTVGFKFLMDTFGECATPRIGWQIDPFGHSREQASLFAQFGFDGLFFGRLDYQDKDTRLKEKTMEMMWMGSANLGGQGSLLTGVLTNIYSQPKGFCFDINCDPHDDPIMDDPRLEDYNVPDRVKDFIKAAEDQAKHYTTNHIMMTMGSDFQYENARENFKNLDKLIKYVNEFQKEGGRYNLMYSTPGCYLKAINNANLTYTAKTDDFFPYASRAHTFWTGYFTSRPALKGYVRSTNNVLQVCKQADALAGLEPDYPSAIRIENLKRAMGVLQHHDAVSGTEKQHVADDYAKRLSIGVDKCQQVMMAAYAKMLPLDGSSSAPDQWFCNMLNISRCDATEKHNTFVVTIYNPLGRAVHYRARIPVTGMKYNVIDPQLQMVDGYVVPISEETKKLPSFKGGMATGELVFETELPPLGFKSFYVMQANSDVTEEQTTFVPQADDVTISNSHLSVTFDGATGLIKTMSNMDKKISIGLQQNLMYYRSMAGNNSKDIFQASGAYAFRPDGNTPIPVSGAVKMSLFKSPLVQEVHQVFGDWASQTVRLYGESRHLEIEYTVGPIPYKDKIGREVISKFSTDLKSDSEFYTDSNGREMLKRIRDYRETWKLNQTEEVAGNYYPVNSRIYIQDKSKNAQLTVLTDRSQGGASIQDGDMELMVHRRMYYDDSFGVGEPLNETGVDGKGLIIRGTHYLILDSADTQEHQRSKGVELYMAPYLSFAPITQSSMTPKMYQSQFNMQVSGLNKPLPRNVHLLTLEDWEMNTRLIRLEHIFEKDEDAAMSKPASVTLKGLFASFEITAVEELTLGANQKLSEATRLTWNVEGMPAFNGDMSSYVTPVDPATWTVVLQPMQIRTFQITIA